MYLWTFFFFFTPYLKFGIIELKKNWVLSFIYAGKGNQSHVKRRKINQFSGFSGFIFLLFCFPLQMEQFWELLWAIYFEVEFPLSPIFFLSSFFEGLILERFYGRNSKSSTSSSSLLSNLSTNKAASIDSRFSSLITGRPY